MSVGVTVLNVVGEVDEGRASGCTKGASAYDAVVTGGVNPPITEGVKRTDLFTPPSSKPSWTSSPSGLSSISPLTQALRS